MSRQQLLAALMPLGNITSGATAGLLSKYIGRKLSLAFRCVIFISGTVTLMLTNSIDVLFWGRFLLGVGTGNFYVFALLYVQVWLFPISPLVHSIFVCRRRCCVWVLSL